MWFAIGALGVAAVVAYIVIAVYSSVNSVSVTFVNDTNNPVVLPDCGKDLASVAARTSTVVNVFQRTAYCSIDVQGGASPTSVRCLKMPRPLEQGAVVRIADASLNTRPCS
jgi:hypothetical protein